MYAYLSDGRTAAERRHGVARHLTAVLIDPPDRSWQPAARSILTHVLTGAMSRAGALCGSLKAVVTVCLLPQETSGTTAHMTSLIQSGELGKIPKEHDSKATHGGSFSHYVGYTEVWCLSQVLLLWPPPSPGSEASSSEEAGMDLLTERPARWTQRAAEQSSFLIGCSNS